MARRSSTETGVKTNPSEGGDEDYVHIASTNMGNIDPGTWNDLENDPQYFPVYGVVEIGSGADYALRILTARATT